MSDDLGSIVDKHTRSEPKKNKEHSWKSGFMGRLGSKITAHIGDYISDHKIGTAVVVAGLIGAGALGVKLTKDHIERRQDYPVRNVIFAVEEKLYVSGGDKTQSAETAERVVEARINQGNSTGTKLGAELGQLNKSLTTRTMEYHLKDADNARIASARRIDETIQSGANIRGSINFSEQYTRILGVEGNFFTYQIVPQRGINHLRFDVLKSTDGTRTIVNELIEKRGWPAWFTNIHNNRAGTELYNFTKTPENERVLSEILGLIDTFHETTDAQGTHVREDIVKNIMELEKKLEKIPVYINYEDGILDIFPQESTLYLFSDPNFVQRTKHWLSPQTRGAPSDTAVSVMPKTFAEALAGGHEYDVVNPNGDILKLRIENHWHLWPGYFPVLNKIEFGEGENTFRPFDHEYNGGYTLKDSHGDIARIEMRDFWYKYGKDVLYSYFLDKNGDGKLNKDTELIGQVLKTVNRDKTNSLEVEVGVGVDAKDVSRTKFYYFMAGADKENALVEFYLCNTMESTMINELNKGFSRDSELGWINEYRGAIMLLTAPTVQNLSRALTPDSGLVVKEDIVALFRAAQRDYVNRYIQAKEEANTHGN